MTTSTRSTFPQLLFETVIRMTASLVCVLLLYVCASALVLISPVHAQEVEVQENIVEQQVQERPRVGRRQALALAQESYSGRVLSVVLERGRWRVRMDEDGNVFNVFVDAASGEVSRPSDPDDDE